MPPLYLPIMLYTNIQSTEWAKPGYLRNDLNPSGPNKVLFIVVMVDAIDENRHIIPSLLFLLTSPDLFVKLFSQIVLHWSLHTVDSSQLGCGNINFQGRSSLFPLRPENFLFGCSSFVGEFYSSVLRAKLPKKVKKNQTFKHYIWRSVSVLLIYPILVFD